MADNYVHDAPQFGSSDLSYSSNGYGIVLRAVVGAIIRGNRCWRTRHSIDVSFFSRNISVVGNHCRAGAFTPIQLHPNVRYCTIVGNTVEGGRGHLDTAPSVEMGEGVNQATGIGVRENCQHVVISGNTIVNMNLSGINLRSPRCSDIVVLGNTIFNVNIRGTANNAGIYAAAAGTDSTTLPGLRIEANLIEGVHGNGIYVGFSGAVIRGNTVRNVRVGGTSASFASEAFGILVTTRDTDDLSAVLVEGNVVEDVDTHGIVLGGESQRPNAETNLGDVTAVAVRSNTIRRTQQTGVIVEQTSDVRVSDWLIESNLVRDCNQDAVTATRRLNAGILAIERNSTGTTARQGLVMHNSVFGTCRYGIRVGLDDCLVVDNHVGAITDADSVGIGIWINCERAGTTCRRVVARGNTAVSCATDGLRISSDSSTGSVEDCLFTGNVLRGNNQCGIREMVLASGNYYLNNYGSDNDASDSNAWSGIRIGGDDAVLFENTCSDTQATATQKYGIELASTAQSATLRDNYGRGNKNAGNIDGVVFAVAGATYSYDDDRRRVVRVDGDPGGLAATVSVVNASDFSANSSGSGVVKLKGSTSRDSAGFVKIYVGTTAYWVPVWSSVTG
jgi:putative cofactor-binding repeat protein